MSKRRQETRISKFMSYLLRHDPQHLKMDQEGFVDTDEFLKLLQARFNWFTKSDLISLVNENERYEISDNRIRAVYGHSIDVSPKLETVQVNILFHGTSQESAERILRDGLKSMNRNKVHLSRTVSRAKVVGRRKARHPVILIIDAKSASDDGIVFEKATDDVLVCNEIPPKYIRVLDDE
ncbi:MAG: RNA 2'-phosphotransferase [Candidatus Helarchaeota archaeon]